MRMSRTAGEDLLRGTRVRTRDNTMSPVKCFFVDFIN